MMDKHRLANAVKNMDATTGSNEGLVRSILRADDDWRAAQESIAQDAAPELAVLMENAAEKEKTGPLFVLLRRMALRERRNADGRVREQSKFSAVRAAAQDLREAIRNETKVMGALEKFSEAMADL